MEKINPSPKLNLILSETMRNPLDMNNNSPLNDLLLTCEDKEMINLIEFKIKIENKNILLFFLLNKENKSDKQTEEASQKILIHKILYEKDEAINVTTKIMNRNLSNYIYLTKLIEAEDDIINYKYDIKLIQELNNFKSKGAFSDVITAKIILELIKNYSNLEEVEDEDNKIILEQIKEKRLTSLDEAESTLGKYNLDYNRDNIEEKKIEEIYINIIINVLLKSGNLEEKNEIEMKATENLIEQLDLKNIELTEYMFEELKKFFDERQNEYINRYKISNPEELCNKKNINFYYNLCLYILKNSFYIYHINFFLELRENIINIIRNKRVELSNLMNITIDLYKLQYIIEFVTGSKYYYDILQKSKPKEESSYGITSSIDANSSSQGKYSAFSSSQSKMASSTSTFYKNGSITTMISKNTFKDYSIPLDITKKQSSIICFSYTERDEYSILSFDRIIMKKPDSNNCTKQLIELKNGDFLELDRNNVITIYDQNFLEKFTKRTLNFKKDKNYYINSYVYNIFESKLEDNKRYIYLLESQTDELVYTKINTENYKAEKIASDLDDKKNIYHFSNYFEIMNDGQLELVVSGNTGIYNLRGISDKGETKILRGKNKTEEYNIRGAIQISDNIFAFVSNDNYINGRNMLVICYRSYKNIQQFEPYIYILKESSFYSGFNSLYLIDIDDNSKLLLCACKKYKRDKKNGILLVNISVPKSKIAAPKFIETDDFEVHCFCTIYENKEGDYSYILVGGFEKEKRRDMVRLYKISYSKIFEKVEIDYIQDAIEDFSRFGEFDGMINNIIRPKARNRDIIICCRGGSNYLFNLPENDDYINSYENQFELN